MDTKSLSCSLPTSLEPLKYTCPPIPPPPYFKTHCHLSSFKIAINTKIDNPIISLFRLSLRLLQFAFALASGISYATELSRGHTHQSAFIYTQVVFGFTLLTLVVDSIMVRYYRFTWLIEWILVVLWFVCFAVFYQAYLVGAIEQDFRGTDVGKMRRAVWCDLVNALLWVGSAIFSSVMCCTGTKAAIKVRLNKRRQRKDKKAATTTTKIGEMESGTIGSSST
jgi:glucan phosphoethanolaminetransferase (alkaline phosphatase superfamily)